MQGVAILAFDRRSRRWKVPIWKRKRGGRLARSSREPSVRPYRDRLPVNDVGLDGRTSHGCRPCLVHKLDAFTAENRAAQATVRDLIWQFYADLLVRGDNGLVD